MILGAQAVALNRQVQGFVERIEVHNRDLRAKERAIPAIDRGQLSVDQFCALPQQPDVEQAIEETERALAGAQEQEAIRSTPSFELLGLPAFDLEVIDGVLGEDLPALEAATATLVQEHLTKLGVGGEEWVADGMSRSLQGDGAPDATCPFCAQDLEQSPVIRHYRAFFGDAYVSLKRTVTDTAETVNQAHGGDAQAGIRASGESRCRAPTVLGAVLPGARTSA